MSETRTHRERVADAIRSAYGDRPAATVDFVAQETRPEDLLAAARGLADRLDEIMAHPSYRSVFTLAAVHGTPYNGPSWEQHLIDLRAAIALYEPEPGS